MNRYVLDFETTFSKENTLKTKSIEAYVRDPKFEVIGCGVRCLATDTIDWYRGGSFKKHAHLYNDAAVICHHAQFDLFILTHVYGIKPAYIFDTLSMARALYPRLPKHSLEAMVEHLALGSPKEVPYNEFRGKTLEEIRATPGLEARIANGCLHDVELTEKLFRVLHPLMPQSELDLIDATVRLFTEPKLVGDIPILEKCLEDAIYEREHLPEKLGVHKSVLLSDRKFAVFLRGLGCEPPTKISPTTGKPTHALAKSDKSFTDLKEHPNAEIRDIVRARLAVKTSISETRAARLLDASSRGSIPVYLRYYGAHTGRFSGGDRVNLQNLPRESELRKGLKAPPGHTLIWADFSQIEARILSVLAGAEEMRTAFRDGRDLYSEFGQGLFGVEISKAVNPHLRYLSKKVILGGGYGAGEDKTIAVIRQELTNTPELAGFSAQITDDVIRLAHSAYRMRYRSIPKFWKQFDQTLGYLLAGNVFELEGGPYYLHGQKIVLPNSMVLDYAGLQHDGQDYWIGNQKLWGGPVTENICSSLARIVMTDAWLNINDALAVILGRIVLTVHDELIACIPLGKVECAIEVMRELMTVPPEWMPDLPLAVEIKSGQNYGREE